MSVKLILVLAAVVIQCSLAFDPCKIGVGVRQIICKDTTAALRFAFGIAKRDENFFKSGAALFEESTDRGKLKM